MLAIDKLVLIVIFVIVLIACLYILFGLGKGSADNLLLQDELRRCCGTYRAYDCNNDIIMCESKTINDLKSDLGMSAEQLKYFCGCPTTSTI